MTPLCTVWLCSVLRQTLGPSWALLFESCQKYQPWVSLCLSVGTSSGGKQIHCLPYELSSQSSSFLLAWYVRVEAVFCSVQWEGEIEHYANQILTATLVRHNVGHQHGCPRDTENKDMLCRHLGAKGPVQPPLICTDQLFVLLVVKSKQQMIHAIVSFFHLYWMPKRDRWKTIPIMYNCFETFAGWVNKNSPF